MYIHEYFTFTFMESPSVNEMPDTESGTITIDGETNRHTHTDEQIDKQIDKQTYRQTNRQTDIQTNR